MSLRRLLPTNRTGTETARSTLENDRTPTYTSNDTIQPGRDSVMLPDKTAPTDALGVAETSDSVVATPQYSKRPSGN